MSRNAAIQGLHVTEEHSFRCHAASGAVCVRRPPRKSGRTGAATSTEGPRTPPAKKPGRQSKATAAAASKPAQAPAKVRRSFAACAWLALPAERTAVAVNTSLLRVVVRLCLRSACCRNASSIASCGRDPSLSRNSCRPDREQRWSLTDLSPDLSAHLCLAQAKRAPVAKRAPAAKRGRGAAAAEVEEVPILLSMLMLALLCAASLQAVLTPCVKCVTCARPKWACSTSVLS